MVHSSVGHVYLGMELPGHRIGICLGAAYAAIFTKSQFTISIEMYESCIFLSAFSNTFKDTFSLGEIRDASRKKKCYLFLLKLGPVSCCI